MRFLAAFAFSLLLFSGCIFLGSGQPQQEGEKSYFANNACLFREQGFDCGATRTYAENGYTYLDLRISNKYGRPITIERVSCVYGSMDDAFSNAYPVEIGLVSGYDYQNSMLPCVDPSGNPVPAYPEFRGSLAIWFNFPEDIDQNMQHVATANMLSS